MKAQGRHGEVAAELHTDFPERFAERTRVYGLTPAGERRPLELESFWPHKGRVVLKFRGVNSISAAEELAGWEVQIPREERAPLEPGTVYISDLTGCAVIVEGREIGFIADVQFGAGEAPLLVVKPEGQPKKEYLLPLAEEFVEELDAPNKRVRLKLPEGMLELDAPLSAEEKAQQKRGSYQPSAIGNQSRRS